MNNIHSTIHEMHFNSRPSARGDEKIISALEKKVISIHAPPRGATPTRTAASGRPEYFNSRPSARGDGAVSKTYVDEQISIHAPPRGATRATETAAAWR